MCQPCPYGRGGGKDGRGGGKDGRGGGKGTLVFSIRLKRNTFEASIARVFVGLFPHVNIAYTI